MDRVINSDLWFDKYKPIKNHIANCGWLEIDNINYSFETYDEELDFVRSKDNKKIWTMIESDNCRMIVNGYRLVDRCCYFICDNEWQDNEDLIFYDWID